MSRNGISIPLKMNCSKQKLSSQFGNARHG